MGAYVTGRTLQHCMTMVILHNVLLNICHVHGPSLPRAFLMPVTSMTLSILFLWGLHWVWSTVPHPQALLCGNVRYNTHLYCLVVKAGFYSDAVECLTATQEILV